MADANSDCRGRERSADLSALGLAERLSVPEPNTGCWLWLAALHHGYAKFAGRLVTRLLLSEGLGRALSSDEFACHRCDVPSCVNPGHLFIGSNRQNQLDKIAKGRQAKGSHNGRAKLDEDTAVLIRIEAGLGEPVTSLARRYRVDRKAIREILDGNTWRHARLPADWYENPAHALESGVAIQSGDAFPWERVEAFSKSLRVTTREPA